MEFKPLSLFGRKNDTLASLHSEIDKVFDSFFEKGSLEQFGNGLLLPRVDIAETDKEIKVTAELPGVDEKDVDVSLEDKQLTIRGEKRQEKEEKGKSYYRSERSYGKFMRSFTLPYKVKPSQIKATFEKGILNISIPKPKGVKSVANKVTVKSKK